MFASCVLRGTEEATALSIGISYPSSLDVFHWILLIPVFWIHSIQNIPSQGGEGGLNWQKLNPPDILRFVSFFIIILTNNSLGYSSFNSGSADEERHLGEGMTQLVGRSFVSEIKINCPPCRLQKKLQIKLL